MASLLFLFAYVFPAASQSLSLFIPIPVSICLTFLPFAHVLPAVWSKQSHRDAAIYVYSMQIYMQNLQLALFLSLSLWELVSTLF